MAQYHPLKICPHCLQAFKPKRKDQVYCSVKCRDLAYKKRKYAREKKQYYVRECKNCGEIFITSDSKKHFCSKKCKSNYNVRQTYNRHIEKYREYNRQYRKTHPEIYYNEKRKLQKTQHFIEENNLAREKSIQSKIYKTPYSKEEDEFLLWNWDKLTKKEIALKLNRTIGSVQSRYKKLKKKN